MSFQSALAGHQEAIDSLNRLTPLIEQAAKSVLKAIQTGGKVYWMGNGGSAADAQHYAAELMVRFTKNRRPIPSIALTTDTSLITAHSNDFGYETVFERQVEALVEPNDVVVGISTSGNSSNVLLAMKKAGEKGALTLGLLGRDGGEIRHYCDNALVVESQVTAHIQEAHLIIGHYLCDYIEAHID